jgi:hypothetical protein
VERDGEGSCAHRELGGEAVEVKADWFAGDEGGGVGGHGERVDGEDEIGSMQGFRESV